MTGRRPKPPSGGPVRLVHISDVHLGSDTDPHAHLGHLAAFLRYAAAEPFDVLLVTGDLFENNRVRESLIDGLVEELGRCPRVLVLPGNHDALTDGSVYRRFAFEDRHPALRVFRDPEGECIRFEDLPLCFWGRPTVHHGADFHPLAGVPEPPPEGGVVLGHGEVLHGSIDAGVGSPITWEELSGTQWDYVALGHRPGPQILRHAPPAAYAGDLVRSGAVGGMFVTVGGEGPPTATYRSFSP